MNIDFFEDSPSSSIISFHKVIDALREIAKEKKAKYRAEYAKSLLQEVEKVPELYSGITSKKVIYENVELIQNLLADLFPTALTYNEIKAVSLPFQNFNFNFTKRFQQIIIDAGDAFEINIRDFYFDDFYIISCCMIMNQHYNQNFDVSRPLFYDIPDKDGVIRHYRITYNSDFVELIPTDKAVTLTEEDINTLKNNYNNIELWKEKFPKHSWILKGFGIITLFDVTFENSISTLKSNLIKSNAENTFIGIIQNSFQSIFKLSSLKVGLVFLNNFANDNFELTKNIHLYSFFSDPEIKENEILKQQCAIFFKEVEKSEDHYCVSNIDDLIARPDLQDFAQFIKSKNIESFILARLNSVDSFQVFIEIVSDKKYALHTVNAKKLNEILPFLNDTIDRVDRDVRNQLEAIIQREFTTIHPSVYWKFLDESRNYFRLFGDNKNFVFNEIKFENVYPLYGETDIKGSTLLRNKVTKQDLDEQLALLISMFDFAKNLSPSLLFEQRYVELVSFKENLTLSFNTHSEYQIQNYVVQNIHPVLEKFSDYEIMKQHVLNYYDKLDDNKTKYYQARKEYDKIITEVNKSLASIIDDSQAKIQLVFPHYFERFKADGIEYNAFIGASITPQLIYDDLYLFNLRLWQIQTMCDMIRQHYNLFSNGVYNIDLTSLIFVYNFPINIRFRYDEKRFDVSSSSDVRYQVIKKRIDKSHIKNTEIRIVQPKYLTIVYLNENDKVEYLKYLNFLIHKKYFIGKIEDYEIEDLQDITGLRALQVEINLNQNSENTIYYSYSDLN